MSFDCYDARSFRRQRIKEVAIALGLSTAISLIAIFAHPAQADARPRHHHSQVADANGNDPRPRAWCGWWLRQYLGVKDRAGNLARWWADFGTRASGPAVGVIVVWARGRGRGHVGIITGRTDSGWIVKSGNDGHAVRERERSLRGVIAYRWPHGSFALN